MTPGLQRGPPFPAKAKRDAVVAIASLENPSVPRVVGTCEIDVSALQSVQGAKGHAVRGEHWDGDEIWAWSNTGKTGGGAPDFIEGWDVNDGNTDWNSSIRRLNIEDEEEDVEDGGVSLSNGQDSRPTIDNRNPHVDGEDVQPYEQVDVEEKELSTKGIDASNHKVSLANDSQRSMMSF